MASADSSQFVVTTADETACETSTLKVRTLSPHLSATSTRTSGNFWTSSLLADLSVFPSLICDFCPSDQGFAYSFFQIPPHDGHPCCSAIHFLVAQACSGLSPVRARPWRANQKKSPGTIGGLFHAGLLQPCLLHNSAAFIHRSRHFRCRAGEFVRNHRCWFFGQHQKPIVLHRFSSLFISLEIPSAILCAKLS